MASKKAAAKTKKASGRNVAEAERGTVAMKLRLDRETASEVYSLAAEHGWTVSRTMKEAFAALNRELNAEVANR